MTKNEKKLYTIAETITKNGGPLPLSLPGLYKLCAEGKIPAVTIGKRVFIPSWYLEKILNENVQKNYGR